MIIRQATANDIAGIAKVHVATWQTAYRGLVSEGYLKNRSIDHSQKIWQRSLSNTESTTFVAECEDGQIVGFISFGPNRMLEVYPQYTVEIYAIYILEAFSRKGLGSRLFRSAIDFFREQGDRFFLLWMLQGNSTVHFYLQHGGVRIGRKPIRIGEQDFIASGYGFEIK